jgi:tetratricopeptide (TPR) repeat protein
VLDLFSKSALALVALLLVPACVSAPGSHDSDSAEQAPIENPFGTFAHSTSNNDNQSITLRTKRGDQAVEVELPQDQNSEFTVPMNPKFSNARGGYGSGNAEAALGEVSENGVDYQYQKQKPTTADREIASTFNNPDDGVNDAKKREIENALGLQASDEPLNMDESYLAKMDVVKQLFHGGRFEAALIEVDRLVKLYPTNGRLYEMRGTCLDRLGYPDLALKSWKQAFEFEPRKLSLKKIIDKREAQRSVASEKR